MFSDTNSDTNSDTSDSNKLNHTLSPSSKTKTSSKSQKYESNDSNAASPAPASVPAPPASVGSSDDVFIPASSITKNKKKYNLMTNTDSLLNTPLFFVSEARTRNNKNHTVNASLSVRFNTGNNVGLTGNFSAWEKIEIVPKSDGNYTLFSEAKGGHYLSSITESQGKFNTTNKTDSLSLKIIFNSNGTFSFQPTDNNSQYLSTNNKTSFYLGAGTDTSVASGDQFSQNYILYNAN